MNQKKKWLFFITFFSLLSSLSYASYGNTEVLAKMVGFVQLFSGLIVGFSVILIVYAGFKYVMSVGDPQMSESAKNQIVSAGIGIFIAMTASVIAKIFLGVSGGEDVKAEVPKIPGVIFIFPIIILFGFITFLTFRKSSSLTAPPTEETDKDTVTGEEPILNIIMSDFLEFVDYLEKNPFTFDKKRTTISSSNQRYQVDFVYNGENSVLIFNTCNQEFIVSTFKLETNQQEYSVSDNIHLAGETHTLNSKFTSVHQSFVQQFNRQHYSIDDYISSLIQHIASTKVKGSISELVTYYQNVLSYHHQLNDEQLFFLEESFLNDLENMLFSFKKLSHGQQVMHETSIMDKLSVLHNSLSNIEESINKQLERDVLFAFRIIDEKYRNNI